MKPVAATGGLTALTRFYFVMSFRLGEFLRGRTIFGRRSERFDFAN
ncbi:MAG: hypothetical protein KAT46_06075 [Deltaproteobacteria bacterium]|nr:hypothetical protein [Deltaproteobacteria bacterium]